MQPNQYDTDDSIIIKLPVEVEVWPDGAVFTDADGRSIDPDEIAKAINAEPLTRAERAVVRAAMDWSRSPNTAHETMVLMAKIDALREAKKARRK